MAAEETRTYTIRNVDQKAKTLIVEHPIRPGYTLLNQKPTEKTATNYRFEVQLAAGATVEFPVNEERVYDQTYSLVQSHAGCPGQLCSQPRAERCRAPPASAHRRPEAADRGERPRAGGGRTADASVPPTRSAIRRNIDSLNTVTGQQQQVQNYARQIDAIEQQLATLRDRQAELQKKKAALQQELDRQMEALSF